MRLYARGCTFQEIADQAGFANRGTVHRMINSTLKEQIVDDIEALRTAKGQELHTLLGACWTVIDSADVTTADRLKALGVAVKIQGELIKLFSLDCHECDMSWRMLVKAA